MKKRCLSALLAIVMVFAVVSLAQPSVSAAEMGATFTPGTYRGTSAGFGGPMTVEVTVSQNRIESVGFVSHFESMGFGDVAMAVLSDRIIRYQSLGVDYVAGATITSHAITLAAMQALTEAAGEIPYQLLIPLQQAPLQQAPTENVDVVIVGSGLAGLMAAYELHFYHPEVSFIMLEQLDILTGQLPTVGGTKHGPTSPLHTANDVAYTVDDLIGWFEYTSRAPQRHQLLRNVYSHSYEAFVRWLDWGATFEEDPILVQTVGDRDFHGFRHTGLGAGITEFFLNFIDANPMDVRAGNRATGLLVNNSGAVYGVTVQSRYAEYEIHAGAVLLATGGFGYNQDLMEEFEPNWAAGAKGWARKAPGATGDGILFTRQFGTPIVGSGVIFGDIRPSIPFTTIPAPFIVATDGQRFINEDHAFQSVNSDNRNVIDIIEALGEGSKTAFRIADSELTIGALEARLDAGVLMQHDTLEDLAIARGIDVAAFLATVEAHNAAVAAGQSPGFGLPADVARTIETAPFFSELITPSFIGTIPGILVDDYLRVLDRNENPVPNLYAAGEVMFGNAFARIYPGSGTGIGFASYSGLYAARVMLADLGLN